MGRQELVFLGVEDVVGKMDEEGAAGLELLNQGQGLPERQMFGMRTRTKGAEDKGVEIVQLVSGSVGHRAKVGAIGQ